LVVLAMITLMGGDTAEHSAVGGPEADVSLFGDSTASADLFAAPAPTATSGMDSGELIDAADALAGDESGTPEAADETDDAATTAEPDPMPTVVTHVVQRGETLWDIALAHGIDVDTIVAANDIVDINRLRVGEQLKILTVRGALHTVRRGESLWDISRTYNVSMDEIVATNRIADPSRIQVNQQLIIPGGQAAAAALRREQLVSSTGQLLRNFDWPTRGRISSRYGPRWGRIHYGL